MLGKEGELKNWMPEQKKSRQLKVVGVELRAGRDANRSEKPGWSAGDMDKLTRKLIRHPVSPKGVLGLTTIFNDLPKVSSSHPRSSHPRSSHSRSSHPGSSHTLTSKNKNKIFCYLL